MKRILPLIFAIVGLFIIVSNSHAQGVSPTPTPDAAAPAGRWVKDQEVTFVGKTATRANEFLQWTLENYNWIDLPGGAMGTNPILDFWKLVRNIVFSVLALFVEAAAFLIIISHGQSLTALKFIKRFVIIVLLIVLAYATVRFLYQTTDIIQGFFLNVKDQTTGEARLIGPQDLLYIAFNYQTFTGFRQVGFEYDESAFISLLLVKLTAITYYVMTGLLIIRKIILWFFIIVSPIFPLLLFFRPVRNTGKIWVGEFFRWLLYAPLFALFLHGLVKMWRDRIPLNFDFATAGKVPGTDIIYPTAINILLGGPGQQIGINNSVNLRDTFALYVVALLMLWVVILLPFLLLQIFLDYLNNVSITENPVYKRISTQGWFNKSFGSPPPAPGQPPQMPSPFGLAKTIPFFNKRAMQIPTSRSESVLERASQTNLTTVRETKDVLRLANLTIPKMRDIARYETSMIKHDTVSKQEVSRFHETLERISKPTNVTTPVEREKFTTIKEKLISQEQKGDKLASSVMAASKITEESRDKTKAVVPGEKAEGTKVTAVKDIKLPQTNQVQQVSIEEYEEVRKMWTENYQNMDAPVGPNGTPMDKHAFIQQDIEKIMETINLLSSDNQDNVNRGMEQVANILPFLLIGGFTKTEVVSYLKAKLEAAKGVLTDLDKKKEDESTMVERETHHEKAENEMVMREELPADEEKASTEDNPAVTDVGGKNMAPENHEENEKKDDNGQGGGIPPLQ